MRRARIEQVRRKRQRLQQAILSERLIVTDLLVDVLLADNRVRLEAQAKHIAEAEREMVGGKGGYR